MYQDTAGQDFVNEEIQDADERESIGFMIYVAGRHIRAVEFCGGTPTLGGKGNIKGRGSQDVSEEQREKNRKKTRNRRKRDLKDCVNANEEHWTAFDTMSYKEEVRDPDILLHDLDVFHKFVSRKARERYGEDFVLKYIGAYGFQDGKRRHDKQGRFVLHAHEVNNLPYWEVQTIVIEDATTNKGEVKHQCYLLNDGTLSKIATRDTLYFDGGCFEQEHEQARHDGEAYLAAHWSELQQLAGKGRRVRLKKLPFYTISWGKGHYHRRWFKTASKHMRKYAKEKGKDADFGAYMAGNYMLSDDDRGKLSLEEVEKFDGKKGWFHSHFRTTKDGVEKHPGGLEKVRKLYNAEAKQFLIDSRAWDCLTRGNSFYIANENKVPGEQSFEVGDIVMYHFNLHAVQYPTIKTLPLDKALLALGEDFSFMHLAIDDELERRELEQQRAVMNGPPVSQESVWIQEEFWGYSPEYEMQCVF